MDKVLVVEDSAEVRTIVRFYLTQDGAYDVHEARDAEEAFAKMAGEDFDAVLLDIMLPGLDGISLCEKVRSTTYCPIIFISCLDDDETIVRAMGMGGDDYLVKPFSGPVLRAHLAACIRRSRMPQQSATSIEAGDLVLDPITRTVTKGGNDVGLSMTEYQILYYLMRKPGEYVPFEDLFTGVWGMPSCGDYRTLFTHVANLRKKIEDDPRHPEHIITRQRSGYVFR